MEPPSWLPDLPAWVPYPFLVWFVVEGAVLAVLGVLIRDLAGPVVGWALTLGNVLLFVGVSTVVLASVVYFFLLSVQLYR